MHSEIISIDNLKPWLESTIPIFILAWLCLRTGSWYPILFLAWKIIVSREANKNKHISDYLSNQRDLNQFRAFTLIKSRTIKHAEKIIKWCIEKDVSHEEIRICGNLFDIEKFRIKEEKLPSKKFKIFIVFPALSIATFVFYVSMLVAASNSVILQFKNEGPIFFLNETEARPIFTLSDEILRKDECISSNIEELTIFTTNERKIICDHFISKDLKFFVEKNVAAQRFVFGYFSIVFLMGIYIIVTYIRRTLACVNLLEKLNSMDNIEIKADQAK
jgi:hypothetical protein